MNIIVLLKQTFDTEAKIVVNKGKIDPTGVDLVINPYDEYAVEEALKLKEAFGGDVTVVSTGGESTEGAIRTALAMGCDKAVLVTDTALPDLDGWAAAELIAKALADMPCDLVLAGRIAIDDQAGQVALRVAELLGIPSVSSILELQVDGTSATVTREIDGGKEVIHTPIPALFTAQKGLNEPRYPNMMGIMKAKQKEVKKLTLADIGATAEGVAPKMEIRSVALPTPRTAGTILQGEPQETAPKLAQLLREEAKVI